MAEHLAKVVAAVVTFNPAGDLRKNILSIRDQVDDLIVIDNASREQGIVEEIAIDCGCKIIKNNRNMGIAFALSQAATEAERRNFDWLATFDQDSHVSPGSISGLVSLYESYPDRERVALIGMTPSDRVTGYDYMFPRDVIEDAPEWRVVRSAITSGSLVRVNVFSDIGKFDDDLFIDSVDHDFCLRARKAGYKIVLSKSHFMDHSIGDIKVVPFGPFKVLCTNHSPLRRYYMTRNQLEVCRRYMTFDPSWSARHIYHVFGSSVVTLLFEDRRPEKAWAIVEGIRDFVFGKLGTRGKRV